MAEANFDLVDAIDELKLAMHEEVRGQPSDYDQNRYGRLRKALLQHSGVQNLVPEWMRRSSSLREAVSVIKADAGDEAGKWARRDTIVRDGLNKVRDALEGADVTASDRFEIGEVLGTGGFGEVRRCRHRQLQLDFAIKFLHPSVFADETDHSLERFFREARILFGLRHDNIVRVFDVGVMGRRPFIQMELVAGPSIRDRLRAVGGVTVSDARAVATDLAAAMAHAHERGVIHRDLKPSNVITPRHDHPILLDFGLGALVEDELVSRITRTGEAAAGGVYAAPELLRDPKLLEPKTDVYSLGVLWFEMLTGHTPSGDGVRAELEEYPEVSPEEADVLLSCLSPVARRPSSAQLRDSLQRIRARWNRA